MKKSKLYCYGYYFGHVSKCPNLKKGKCIAIYYEREVCTHSYCKGNCIKQCPDKNCDNHPTQPIIVF